jgi:hypothetical protein
MQPRFISKTLGIIILGWVLSVTASLPAGVTMSNDSFVQQLARSYWWGHTPSQTKSPLPLPGNQSATAS